MAFRQPQVPGRHSCFCSRSYSIQQFTSYAKVRYGVLGFLYREYACDRPVGSTGTIFKSIHMRTTLEFLAVMYNVRRLSCELLIRTGGPSGGYSMTSFKAGT